MLTTGMKASWESEMSHDDDRAWDLFLELQRGLPRQGPGSLESTARALGMVQELGPDPLILDLGCGPGMQTLHLAELLPGARITAVDNLLEFLEELESRAREQGVEDRIQVLSADMGELELEAGSYDLIWSEGAAYSIGLDNALQHWRNFLLPGGHLAFTELVWFEEGPPPEAVRYWAEGYPEMRQRQAVGKLLEDSGYQVVGTFDLPSQDWWRHYYGPLEGKIQTFRNRHADDDVAQGVADEAQEEMEIHRRFSDCYGYAFFVARRGE